LDLTREGVRSAAQIGFSETGRYIQRGAIA
jgi:hypothetical protein